MGDPQQDYCYKLIIALKFQNDMTELLGNRGCDELKECSCLTLMLDYGRRQDEEVANTFLGGNARGS
jgi:hypothetical protein